MSMRLSAIGPARQAFETPEGDNAGLAALLADELFVTEHEASTLERKGGSGPPAMRTDQGEISCAPAQNEMSQPVHVFLYAGLCGLRASPEHSRGARKSGKVWDTRIRFEWPRCRHRARKWFRKLRAIAPAFLRGRRAMEPRW